MIGVTKFGGVGGAMCHWPSVLRKVIGKDGFVAVAEGGGAGMASGV